MYAQHYGGSWTTDHIGARNIGATMTSSRKLALDKAFKKKFTKRPLKNNFALQ